MCATACFDISLKYLIYVMTKVIQLTAAVTYFTVVVVASMSTTDVWRGMMYCKKLTYQSRVEWLIADVTDVSTLHQLSVFHA